MLFKITLYGVYQKLFNKVLKSYVSFQTIPYFCKKTLTIWNGKQLKNTKILHSNN